MRGMWGVLLLCTLALPPARAVFEQSMAGHMLLQLPLLILGGTWIASGLPAVVKRKFQAANRYGLSGLAMVLVTALYWMLPRHLDAALDDPVYEAAKFVMLPLLVGIPLKLSWRRLTAIGRGLVWSNLVAMLWVLAWLYLAAPVRVCNNYLVDEQTQVGQFLFLIGSLIATGLAIRPFISSKMLCSTAVSSGKAAKNTG